MLTYHYIYFEIHLLFDAFSLNKLCELKLDFFFLGIVDLGSLLVSLFVCVLNDHMSALFCFGQDSLLHFLDTFLDTACHHRF